MKAYMSLNSRAWIWIVVAVLVVVAIVAIFFSMGKRLLPYTPPNSGPTPTYAPAGQVISGFPSSLLIDSGATVSKSYALAYSSTTDQYTVEWNSTSLPQGLVAGYAIYLQSNGWRIVSESTNSSEFKSLYAAGKMGMVNLTATTKDGGAAAILSYIPAPKVAPLPAPALASDLPAFLNPDASATLISANTNNSFETAIFFSKQKVQVLATALLSSFARQKWQVVQHDMGATSASMNAVTSSSQAMINIQALPSGETQLQIQYLKLP